ncbi:M56 family metallopeptidase [Anaerotruncus colihominis]|uniref:M56 family metallopeptidase n=1 Tax=Anaerotruncus colihominis TaxID=169435 RepID=UPI001FAD5C08|nr:M56 family metallopeptidase [Anaerotruncus colihominis]
MNAVLKIFLSMSVSGGLLILLLLLGKRFFKDKISRQWQYYIWLVVVLRLLLPFGPEVNLLGKTYEAVDQAISQAAPLPPRQQPPLNVPGDNPAFAVGADQHNETVNSPAEDVAAAHSFQAIGMLLINYIWLVWLTVALGLLIRKITIYQGFIRYIRAGLTPVSDIERLDRLSIAAEQSGVKKPIELCVNPLVSSPLLIGFFHPCIVLPSADIPEKDFRYIVLHELTHYKRRDMFYKWLVQVTVCLHWFNPLVHLMSREITKACEFSCDEAVLAKMGSGNAQDYGKTLLDAMAAVGKYKENLGAVTLSENKQLLKERLGAIMKFKEPSKAVKILTIMLTLFLAAGASFVGVYTAGTAQAAPLPNTPLDITGRPALSLDIRSAAVNVLAAPRGSKIYAEFNEDVYQVEPHIDGQQDIWSMSISCKTNTNNNDETIKLYIPDIAYGDVTLNVDNGHLTCDLIRSGNIVGNFNMASVFLTLPEGFAGSVDATANSGYFQLISQDDFKNTTTTITDHGSWGEIYKPKNFKENGNTATFTDGTGNNVIRVTRQGSGVMGIYTSNAFDTSSFPDGWKNLWRNEWQGKPWEDDWQQNTWQEDDTPKVPAAPGERPEKADAASTDIERYYEADSLPLFQIAFSRLDESTQKKWLEKLYDDGDSAFFSVAAQGLDENSSLLTDFAEKAYAEEETAFFSILTDCMEEAELGLWLDRALEDGNWAFQSMLFDKLGRNDEFDELEEKREKEWDEARKAEYGAVGVTINGKNYYYQGQLVDIFLDIVQQNKSFYVLSMNPKGTVNIKILRDADNKITGVAYMTEAEVTQLLEDG